MNFFEHQDNARRSTVRLVMLFCVAIATMIFAIYGVVVITLNSGDVGISGLWQPEIFLIVAMGVLGTVGMGSLTKTLQLRGGGKVVALSLGGRLVSSQTQNVTEQRLLNVVEEMAIASGTPIPPVYLMEHETGINAFAAGFTINDAVIGVTKGCVEELSRDQLQGVIAHEFSHIINGDMRLNLRLIGVLQGILLIHLLGRMMMRGMWYSGGYHNRRRGDNGKGGGFIVVMAIALTGIGLIGFLCGRLIKSAVSRQREFLADASAVQFTRNPLGISGALRKIGGYSQGSVIMTPKAEEASHLFFGEALSSNFSNLFATHPPLDERIRRLENLPDTADLKASPAVPPNPPSRYSSTSPIGFAATPPPPAPPSSGQVPPPTSPSTSQSSPAQALELIPNEVVSNIGTATPKHLDYARSLLNQLPGVIKVELNHKAGAQCMVYGLLLETKNKGVRDRQLNHLQQTEAPDILSLLRRLLPALGQLPPHHRLPLVDLAIPALRDLPKTDYARLFKQVQALVQADGRVSLSEYALQVVLMRRLEPYFSGMPSSKIHHTAIGTVWQDCLTLLSGLANVGHGDLDQATMAFRSGAERLPEASKHGIPAQPPASGISSIGKSLNQLATASPKLKQAIVDACAHTVLMDGQVTVKEAELLRAIVISLDCPIPPFLEQ
ncbi:MAG: M48 family metallopeptidase [Leptolyngbyaceae cyanobacterium]